MKSTKKILLIAFVTIGLFISLWIPIIIFKELLLENENTYWFNRDKVSYMLILALNTVLWLFLTPKFFITFLFKIFLAIVTLTLLVYIFEDIAYISRIEFGTTWEQGQVFWALVWGQWYFFPLLLLGIADIFLVNFLYYKAIKNWL